MKWTCLMMPLLFILSTFLIAQPVINKGIRGGLNIAMWGGDGSTGTESITHFCGGGFLEVQYDNGFAIQPEFLYTVKGMKAIITGNIAPYGNVTINATQTLSYLEIPFLLKYNLPTKGIGFGIYTGPSLAILMSARIKAESNIGNGEDSDKDIFSSLDLGLVVGGGFKIPLEEANITLDARFTLGVLAIDKDRNSKTYNRVFSILTGLSF